MSPTKVQRRLRSGVLTSPAMSILRVIAPENWMRRPMRESYSYHFEWLGRPIIQYPQDIVAMQETDLVRSTRI